MAFLDVCIPLVLSIVTLVRAICYRALERPFRLVLLFMAQHIRNAAESVAAIRTASAQALGPIKA